jgi:hypothetical protein
MTGVNSGALAKIETTIGTLMVNPIKIMIRKRIIKRKGSFHQGESSKNYGNSKIFEGRCYNYGKNGHMKKDYWFKKSTKNNAAILRSEKQVEDEWNAAALFAIEKEEINIDNYNQRLN